MPTNSAIMAQLSPHLLRDTLDLINISNSNIDKHILYNRILDVLLKIVNADSSVLFLTDENENITKRIIKNLSKKKSDDFGNYFCKLDPFQLVQGTIRNKSIIRLEEIVDHHSFLNTEYYNDFYKPQKIYHKLVIYLQAKGRQYGAVCVHKPSNTRNFSRQDIKKLQTVTPYFVYALEHNELQQKIKFKDDLLNVIDDNLSTGIIILDNKLKMVHINKQAREFCQKLYEGLSIQNRELLLPPVLTKDCERIKDDLQENPYLVILPKNRVFQVKQSAKYNVSSRLIKKEYSKENNDLFMISIERVMDPTNIDVKGLIKIYKLTEREAEITKLICNGLKNAEIAQKLFVAEITVKWHIHNIFEKVNVKTRIALIKKVLSQNHHISNQGSEI